MNYRHIYHAGSFTDVFKHIIQIALIQALQQKPAPFCYLDTHAGIGLYQLQSSAARKTNEANTGIIKIIAQDHLPELVQVYLGCVQALNLQFAENEHANNHLAYYPGSPLIANYFSRPQDKIIACELHRPAETLFRKLCPCYRVADLAESFSPESEPDLLRRAQAGDEAAFGANSIVRSRPPRACNT